MASVCCLQLEPTLLSARGAPPPLARPAALEDSLSSSGLLLVARACSPRIERLPDGSVVFDAGGLSRVIGSPQDIAAEVTRLAAERGLTIRVAIASSAVAARLLAHAHRGMTVSAPGEDASRLSVLPVEVLRHLPELAEFEVPRPRRKHARAARYRMAPGPSAPEQIAAGLFATLESWGIHTLGEIARLPRAELRTRFGDVGVRLHQAVSGEDDIPLAPEGEPARFRQVMDLEWPIDGLEPLSFVLARLCDSLSAALERADRGAIAIALTLDLVTRRRPLDSARGRHLRTLQLPAPMRDAKILRTLMLLDLESHPPDAAIDRVTIDVGVSPARIVQGSLLARALPSPEDLATLVARLTALMGESRVGAPTLVDSYDERRVAMEKFYAVEKGAGGRGKGASEVLSAPCLLPPAPCLRRFRLPVAVRVTLERGVPVRVAPSARGLSGGIVRASAGPWRTSGFWWSLDGASWQREEWDVELPDGALYRLVRDRARGTWELEGIVD